MSVLLKQVQKELQEQAAPEAKAAALKFVPNAEKVYGIRSPVLNLMAKKYREGGFGLVKELWYSGAFEERLLAAKLLNIICKKDPLLSLKHPSEPKPPYVQQFFLVKKDFPLHHQWRRLPPR